MNDESRPTDADTERYDEIVRKLFPASKEEMQRHEALWQEMQKQGKKVKPKKS